MDAQIKFQAAKLTVIIDCEKNYGSPSIYEMVEGGLIEVQDTEVIKYTPPALGEF